MPEVLLVPDMKLFAGNATPELAQRIANRLYTSLGDAAVGRFSDGEVSVQINENVRGGDIFIIQSTCAPTNDNLMELVVMVDALRRASAGRITAVMQSPTGTNCFFSLWAARKSHRFQGDRKSTRLNSSH